jgi:hypothetical protein
MPKYNNPRRTWQYSKDFKVNAIQLSYVVGVTIKSVAKNSTYTRLCCHDGEKNIVKGSLWLINEKCGWSIKSQKSTHQRTTVRT